MSLYLFVRQMRISLEEFLVKLEIVPESVLVLECESVGGEQPLIGLPDLDHAAVLCYLCPGPGLLLHHLPLTHGLVTIQAPEQVSPALTSCL